MVLHDALLIAWQLNAITIDSCSTDKSQRVILVCLALVLWLPAVPYFLTGLPADIARFNR